MYCLAVTEVIADDGLRRHVSQNAAQVMVAKIDRQQGIAYAPQALSSRHSQ